MWLGIVIGGLVTWFVLYKIGLACFPNAKQELEERWKK